MTEILSESQSKSLLDRLRTMSVEEGLQILLDMIESSSAPIERKIELYAAHIMVERECKREIFKDVAKDTTK